MRGCVRAVARGAAAAFLLCSPPSLAQARDGGSVPVRAPGYADQGAVAAAIRREARGDIAAFYRERGYWPIWMEHGGLGRAADALLALLPTVAADGLDPGRYATRELTRRIADAHSGDPRAVATAEVALSRTLASLIADMREPHAEMAYADPGLAPRRQRADALLRRAAAAPSLTVYVAQLQWMNPLYVGLRATGARDAPRIVLDPDDADLFGVARKTRSLQGGTQNRRLNLERARLLPDAITPHIVVDTAGSRLWYIAAGKIVGEMRVVTGTPDTPTPMMAGMLRYATFNPYWNVPVDLVRRRLAPALVRGKSLRAMGYEALSDWSADARPVDAATIDWRAVADGRSEVRVRELPGGGNSMGRVKFTFPNDEGIYLHDTPDKTLFARADRHFSNGCVRLEDAARLTRWLLPERRAGAGNAPEQQVALPTPVPVYLTYLTTRAENGRLVSVPDVYRRDGAP